MLTGTTHSNQYNLMACLAPLNFGIFYSTSPAFQELYSFLPACLHRGGFWFHPLNLLLPPTDKHSSNMSWACSFDHKAFCDSYTWISKVFCWHRHTATAHPDAGLLSDCESLRAAAFTVVVVPTGATWCSEACKLDTVDDLACFWALQAKCWPWPLQLLLGRDPTIDLVRMILGHVCAYTCSLLSREGYLAWVTTKLLEKD